MSKLELSASTFGTYPYMTTISQGAPLVFRGVSDASHADFVAGFTYYYSLNGGSYVSSASPEFYLPSYTARTYSVSAYVVDKDGGTSSTFTASGDVIAPQVTIALFGTGTASVTWDGAEDPVELGPDDTLDIEGTAPGLVITLLDSDASYSFLTRNHVSGYTQSVTARKRNGSHGQQS